MSEGSSAVVWQCVHCHEVLSGVPPGSLRYCPFCSRPQQSPQRPMCVNPNCREQLFTPTAVCHKCNAPQQPPPGQQRTALSGPYSPNDRQSMTQSADHSQPLSANPELRRSAPGQGNRTRTGGSFQGGNGDTGNEEFFDAQSVLPQHQATGHPPHPPPSSQSQSYRYPQVFGMQSQHGGHRGLSPGTGVPPHIPHGQLPYYPQPQLPPGSQWVSSPSSQPQEYGHPQGVGWQQQRFPPHVGTPATEMVHGQFSSSPRRPPPLPSPYPPPPPQPPPSQPTSLPRQPPHSSVATPQIHPGQSHTQLPPFLQPQPSQSSQPGQPLASGTSSPQQPYGGGKPPPGPETLKEPIQGPHQPHIQLSPSPQPKHSQASPLSQPSQPLASGTSPHHPSGGGKLHSQPPGPETSKEPTQSPQQPTSDSAPPKKQETDEKMQVTTTQPPPCRSSASEPEAPPKPMLSPSSHSSNTDPTLAVASSSNKLPSEYKDKDSDVTSGDGERKEKGNDGDMESDVASSSGDQSLTQAQDPKAPPEPTGSTTELPPDLQGASDHHVNDGDKKPKDIMNGQKQTDQSEVTSKGSAAKPLPGLQDTSEHPLDSGGNSNQNSEVNKGGRKRTADEDVSARSSAKLPKHETKEGDAKKESADDVKHDAGKGTVGKPPKQPEKAPIQQPGDSQTSETYATVTRQRQPGPSGEREIEYRKPAKGQDLFPGTQNRTKAEKQKQKENGSQPVRSDATSVHKCNYDHSQQSKPMTHLKGLQSPAKKSIQVTFHALVPLPLWGWDATSCMHIQFGHEWLGMWQHDCGNMTVHRDLEGGWCEMTCTLQIDAAILKYPIPYKYVIYSPKMEHRDDCYEYYHVYNWDPNRCLRIAQGKSQQAYGGTYHHYDTVVYPKDMKPPKSWYERTKEKAKSFFGFGSGSKSPEEEDLRTLSPFEMGKLCLQVYLEGYKQMLCSGSFPQKANLQTIVEEICHIFTLLFDPFIFYQNSSTPTERKLDGKFTEVMKEWLESIVDALQDGESENAMNKLVSAVCVTHCLHKIGIFKLNLDKFALPLVRMLYLRPDLERKECPDYQYLCDFLPKQHRSEVAASVAVLCKQTRKGKSRKEWLRAVPLYHFLAASSQPFEKLGMNPEKTPFIADRELELKDYRHKTYDSEEGFIEEHFDKFEHLFALDPCLLRIFVYICPKKDLFSLFERIPTVLSTTWLANMVVISAAGKFNKNEAKEWIDWIRCIQKLTVNQEKEDPQDLVFMTDAALLLFRQLAYKLKTCIPHCVDVLKASISLILFAVAQLKALYPSDEKHHKDETITGAFEILKETLWEWIVDYFVIGGSVFGGTLPSRYSSKSWKLKEELELWQSLLTLEYPPDQQVTEEWHNIVKAHVQKRADVPDKWKFDLVCLLEDYEDIHTILTDVLMEAGTKAVDNMFAKPEYAVQGFERLAALKSAPVGRLLGKLLKKKYPNLHPDIKEFSFSFDDLLHWTLWPNFIKLYGSDSKLKEGLPQECQIACVCALSRFQDVCDHMQKRSISVTELRKIKENLKQMKRLCEAAAYGGKKENGQLSYKAVNSALSQITEEFDAFEKYHSHLSHLCFHIRETVQGLSQLKEELQKDFSKEKINTLCVREGQEVKVICFQSAGSLSVFADKFSIMNQKHPSALFATGWEAAMNAAVRSSAGVALTLADIHSKVWEPAFRNCQSLLQDLHDRSIKLSRIDVCFKRHERDLDMQLTNLFAGVNACLGETKSEAWIKGVVYHVHNYWHLRNCREAASAFLDLKKVLNLQKGDFGDVEKLATEVTTSMKDQTLAAVDESLIKTGKFLEDISSDPKKVQCLNQFAQCQDVTQWLRHVTNDVNDLQNFVNVALATAAGGEDDLAHDKLSDLRTVGSGFGALIYKLPDDAGYVELARRCRSLWEALENYQDLPNKLMHCNKQLEWYKSVKETQGSVEVTSFGKMRNILAYGRYRVGSRSMQAVHSIHDMIHLKLENTGKQLPKTSFSLDDLRDLESKLVLITGSKAENRKEVDQFLNTLHSVCRIADVLLALQQKGNVKYSGWVLSFHCAVDMVDTLQQRAKDMEEELQVWEDQVRQTREQYYELNYYTTLQLLTLRKELGRLKTSGQPRAHTQISPHVLALLESISTEITSPDVWEVVNSVTMEQQGGGGGGGASPFLTQYHPPVEKITANIVGPTFQMVESVPSNQPSIVKEILASADLQASTSTSTTSLQQPKLTQDSLTEKQKEIFANLVNCNYSERAVLMALEKFGEDQYEAHNWVEENAHHYGSVPEVEGAGAEIDEEMGSESDSELESDPDMASAAAPSHYPMAVSVTPKSPKLGEPSTPRTDQSPMVVTQKQPVDEDHPTVQELVEAGYNVEQSIEAVEHSEKPEEALDYLLRFGGEEGIFQASTSVLAEEKHQYREEREIEFMEESQQERARGRETTLSVDEKAEERYLMLSELGRVLQALREALPAAVPSQRHFPSEVLEIGAPNLLVTAPENVLKTALALYMYGDSVSLPLPTFEEVLVCNPATTTEEVTLLWQRAIGDPGFKRIFCLLHAEKLSYQVSDHALRSLTELSHGRKQDYRLVIICSNEDEDKSHIISRLSPHKKHFAGLHDVKKYREYLKIRFTGTTPLQSQTLQFATQGIHASTVDLEDSCVRVVSSTRSGMGKSLFVTRMADRLREYKSTGTVHVTVPIHGPVVTMDTVMEFLKDHMKDVTSTIFHFDIAPSILWEVDTILFCLLVLRGLVDSQGRVWRNHPSQLYAIEVTLPEQPEQQDTQRTLPESSTLALLELLPSVECLSPRQAIQQMKPGREAAFKVVMDRQEFESAYYQRVYQYLRRHIGNINLDRFSYIGNVEGTPANCLEIILHSCGLHDPSWAEIRHFVKFLDIQLNSCEESVFCDETFVGDVMAGLKGFVVKFMIRMSRDFATSSLHGEVAREEAIGPVPVAVEEGEDLEQYQIVERRRWEQSSHPYIFFNQDGMSITFVGFMVTRNGDLIDPARGGVLEGAIMTSQLYTGLKQNRVNFDEDYRTWQKGIMIEKIATVMGIEYPYDPDESYVLTVDNLIKILAIQMRFRCGIPVVIMGETGCGKTRLIRYMCDLARQGMDRSNMLIMKVHGGITESDIIKFVEGAQEEALVNRQHNLDTVVFFDEANTTDAIGLIKEIMCDRRLHGRPISRDLKFIAACNPYRKHSEEMIEKLESAGLGFYVRATETQQKLGRIPLRQLVYRVLDLPQSMRPLVYDFGQLTNRTEGDYTRQIVSDHVKKHPVLQNQQPIIPAVARVLAWSQWYMRNREDECSFVSLRDVERAMIVFEYFHDKMKVFGPKMDSMAARELEMEDEEKEVRAPPPSPDPITRSLLLAISVCYHARLQERKDYEEGVAAQFVAPLGLPGGAAQFRNEIQCCQEVLLDSMTLGPNIAKNAALRENVFMMAICIELRIPLFLVGKPGSSKSLAKSIVQSSMQGAASNSELLRGFKQVHIFSYQCSQLSTPESVIEVFNTAKRFQRNQDTSKYVSVVVLDEVGLAEDSPNLPLKALHPLLEDGTEGADEKSIDREKRVAFIGISNWALDPAKMNRGVMVTRGNPNTKELQLSARGICSNREDDPVKRRLEGYFEPLAKAYKKICKKQKREFFGLRDFYSLIKMLYWMCEKSGLPPTWPQLEHAICRNFGGMESDELDPLEEFKKQIHIRGVPDLQPIPQELHSIVNPDCSRLGLIKTSLMTKETSWHGENRYLLFLTENYAALDILRHYLNDVVRSSPPDSVASISHGSDGSGERLLEKMEPFILFGSSFPRDKEYTQVCRNINQIKICMETGRTVILLNLENLYESLYDVLNQYYIYHGGSRYVDLGLQTHRVKCRVHDNFKLIVIAEKTTVYEKFPTPLINRLEKHFVLTSSVLTEEQLDVLHHFQEWIHEFSSVTRTSEGRKFSEGDAFIGYQKDTPAAVVFQATQATPGRMEHTSVPGTNADEKVEDSHIWKEDVLKMNQYLLLQTASPDALVRLEYTLLADQREELLRLYFQEQHHNSVEDFLAHHIQRNSTRGGGLLMQVTTHSHLLSQDELDHIGRNLFSDPSHVHAFSLQEFDTELDFSNKVGPAFQRKPGDTHHSLLVIQCDSGHLNADLIACARYRIYDKRAEASLRNEREGHTHVLFIIHLPRQLLGSSFVGFQGDPWISAHIDDLRPTTHDMITLHEAMGMSISHLFYGKLPANKEGREQEGGGEVPAFTDHLKEMYQHHETEEEVMQVEGSPPSFQGDFGQNEEMQVEEEGRSRSLQMEQPEMDISVEGGTPYKDTKTNASGVTSDVPKMPEGQIIPEVPVLHTPPPEDSYLHTQFRRLHGCIQPAASRLQDSSTNKERATKRVAILVSLIPRNPSFPLDNSTFHGVLVRHIHRLLNERDQIREDEKNWVLNEALNTRKLQNGGTFQNVLARKLDEVLVPIFSEIIALVDRNYNLDRLVPKNENSPLSQFWLAMFRNSAIVQLRYEDMATWGRHREQVPGAGGRMAEEDFKCQLPFSWLVKEAVDAHWHSAKSTKTGGTWWHLYSQLCDIVSQTAVGDVLGSVGEADCEDFFQYYLHDFVRSVHRCYYKQQKSKNLEYKLISDALNCLVHGPDLASFDGHESLTRRIAALHVVYHFSRPQVLWFGQLVSNLPGIMTTLEDKVPHDDSEMMLHLYAVDHALRSLEPPLDKKETEDKEKATLTQWLNQLRLLQNAVDSILSLPSQSELTKSGRMKWQVIRALQMFVEHVVLKHEGMLPYARRLNLHLQHDADFLKASTVERVKRHLNIMDNELKGKLKSQLKLTPIRKSCRAFFMELVSSLCFGGHSVPEPDLIKMLINMVFTEGQETEVGTRDFSPYHGGRSDKVPIIRSFLLRLLLEHNTEQVKVHLEEYFHKSQQARGELDQNLCLLCIQCFEDALNKEYSLKPSQERATGILEEGHQALQLHTSHSHGKISLGYIEGVANVRFALSVVAEQFHKRITMKPALLHVVRMVCTDPSINHIDDTGQTDTTGPVLYLLKLIVRQFGFPCLTEVSVEHPWVVPHELKTADEEQQTVDPFVIYNPLYSVLRECVSGAVYGKQFQQLTESTRDLTLQDVPLLLLALYEKATLSRASALPSRQLLPDVLEELDKFIKECKVLSKELQWMARSLVTNEQGGPLAQLGISPRQPLQHRTLGAIVVHTAAVFFCRQRVDILQPFVNMLNNPAALVNAYLPTMPEDMLPEARRLLGGAFYECPRGHPYFVGECGRPVQELTCNVCGARIGGIRHALRHDNRNARSNDNTQTGYPLGMPEGRSTVPSPERSLSQAACCIVRALMHSALLWASCNNEGAMEGLMQLVKVNIRPRDLPEFFWHHLERDIELLGRSIGRSMDESAITLHLVLKEILQKDPPTSAVVSTVASLAARNAREQWENIFNQNYIQPVLQGLEQRVTEAMHSVLNDDKQEHDQLFYLVYERVQVVKESLDPHLWAYRFCITLEHLSQTLQQQSMKKKCPILHAFLQEEPNLRATQYLPDIVRLQQYLYDSFHHRLDRREAKTMTIGEFLQSRQHENIRNEYQEMVESLQKAWELVGDKLRDHARLRVDEKHLLPSLTLDTSLEYLIPTTTGAGACTTALTDFLVLTHNNFIENCRGIVSKQCKSKPLWPEHKVPITHIHGCHLLTYEQQLPSLVLSNCHYSLAVGKGQDITYDLPALEKQLLDRFVHGKPLILSDIPQVAYRKDVYTAATFAAVRKNVTQEPLPSRIQQEIIQELRTPNHLRETLDVVDIVLGFLSSGGGKADRPLGEYVHHTLKMKRRPFSEKAREYCTLGHVLSLWETLSVELAQQLTLQGQEPFDSESMPSDFLEELTTDREMNQMEDLNHCLRAFDLEKLLGTLYEFIETYVKHSPSNEKEWPLVDTLEVFLERNGLPEVKHFRDEFPDSITLAQSVAVWKHIVRYQKKLGGHGTNQ